MTRHISTENLTRFRDGDLRGVRARRVSTHLERCSRCREVSATLAEVPALLAAADVPPMPAHLAARIETALATESAQRAAGAPAQPAGQPGQPGQHSQPGRAASRQHRRRGPGLPAPAGRILAAAAAAAVLAGGIEFISHLGGSGGSTASSSTGLQPAAGKRAASRPLAGVASGHARGSPVSYASAGHTATITPVRTGTDYRPGQLAHQVSAALAQVPAPSAASRSVGPNFGTGSGSGQGGGQPRLSGCLSRVAAGRTVLLVDLARFDGGPATVIVTAARGSSPEQAWVVGSGCSASASDVLAHQPLPRR